jgi:DnaJ family protein A protein 2
MKKTITLAEALCGYQFNITHLDKRVLVVKSEGGKDIINTGDFRRIEDEGMPHSDNPNIKGNLYIEFTVEFPDKLDKSVRDSLLKLLPAVQKEEIPEEHEDVNALPVDMKVELQHIQEELEQAAEEEDDERRGHGHGGGGAQCRQA